MPINQVFNPYYQENEQNLLHDLMIEAIQIYGVDMYYVLRDLNNFDKVLGSDDQSSFSTAIQLEMYVKSVDGFTGDGTFISQFAGLEIRDQVTFSIAVRRFAELVGTPNSIIRPREGDIIYFPLNNRVFQIKTVEPRDFFFPLGTLPTYEVICELFEYSSEKFNTGIAGIDALTQVSTNVYDWALQDEAGEALETEDGEIITSDVFDIQKIDPLADNNTLQVESDEIIDLTKLDPYGLEAF